LPKRDSPYLIFYDHVLLGIKHIAPNRGDRLRCRCRKYRPSGRELAEVHAIKTKKA
jgi:hypothetical protein